MLQYITLVSHLLVILHMGCTARGAGLYFGRLDNAQLLLQSRARCNLSIYAIIQILMHIHISLVDSYAPVQRPHWPPLQLCCSCRRLLQHFHWHCRCRCSVQSPLRLESLVASHSRIYCRSSTHVCHQLLQLLILTPVVVRHAVVNDWPHPVVICQFCQCSQSQGNRCRCCCCHCPAVALDSA